MWENHIKSPSFLPLQTKTKTYYPLYIYINPKELQQEVIMIFLLPFIYVVYDFDTNPR